MATLHGSPDTILVGLNLRATDGTPSMRPGRLFANIADAEALDFPAVGVGVGVTVPDFTDVVDSIPITLRPSVRVGVSLSFVQDIPTETSYRVYVTDMSGKQYAELVNAELGSIPFAVTGTTAFDFTLPAGDPNIDLCQDGRYEAQVWRNDRLLWWGPMIRTTVNAETLKVQCLDLWHYFTKRVVGRVPKRNLLVSEDGQPANRSGFEAAFLPRSKPKARPVVTTTMENTYSDRPSIRVSSSAGKERETFQNDDWYDGTSLTTQAKKDLKSLMAPLIAFTNRPRVMVQVYDDNTGDRKDIDARAEKRAEAVADFLLDRYDGVRVSVASPAYRDPLNGNKTSGQREANRRTVITYRSVDGIKGHKQHLTQTVTLRNPSTKERKQAVSFTAYVYIENEAGWAAGLKGVELIRSDPRKKHPDPVMREAGYLKPLQTSTVLFGDGFTPEAWARVQATVVLPNNGKRSRIEVRLFPPNGDALFTEMWMVKDEALSFRRQEQADIARTLIRHAQDPDMGKADLNISPVISRTGKTRSRDYPFSERDTIFEALQEFPTLADGMEFQMLLTPSLRMIKSHYPRMGRDTNVVLAYGTDVLSYGIGTDNTLLATTVVIQAPTGDDYTREERTVSDPSIMDGQVFERVYTGTPNSPPVSWAKQAERGVARYRRPITIPDLTMSPESTEELLNTVWLGDRVYAHIKDEEMGVTLLQKCRVVEMRLDPRTDSLSYTLTPEDIDVVTLAALNEPVRYFSQPQNPIVGAAGKKPVESNAAYAGRAYDDSGWSTGKAGVGWVKEATGDLLEDPGLVPATTVPDTHEVWIRKWVNCTGDMSLNVKAADWAYVYVNGHLVTGDHLEGYNRIQRVGHANLRIPAAWLDPSGRQLVAVHAQFDPARRSGDKMDSVYADVSVRGSYNADEVTA